MMLGVSLQYLLFVRPPFARSYFKRLHLKKNSPKNADKPYLHSSLIDKSSSFFSNVRCPFSIVEGHDAISSKVRGGIFFKSCLDSLPLLRGNAAATASSPWTISHECMG